MRWVTQRSSWRAGLEPPSITTISSPAKAALAAAAGAHHVINYRDEDVATAIRKLAPDGVDLVVEVAIAANAQLNLDVVKPRSSVAIYANDGGREFTLDVRQNMIKNLRYQFVLLYTVGDAALKAAVGRHHARAGRRSAARRGERRPAVAQVSARKHGRCAPGRPRRRSRKGTHRRPRRGLADLGPPTFWAVWCLPM